MAMKCWSHHQLTRRYRVHHSLKRQGILMRIDVASNAPDVIWQFNELQSHWVRQRGLVRLLVLVQRLSKISIVEPDYREHCFLHHYFHLNHLRRNFRRCRRLRYDIHLNHLGFIFTCTFIVLVHPYLSFHLSSVDCWEQFRSSSKMTVLIGTV